MANKYNNYSGLSIKVSGTARTASALYVKVGGTVKTATHDYIKVGGAVKTVSCYSNCTCYSVCSDCDDCGDCGCNASYCSDCDGWSYCSSKTCDGYDDSNCNFGCGSYSDSCGPGY